MIGFTLSEEQISLQNKAREFADTQMSPYAAEIDRLPSPNFDRRVAERFAAAGLTQLVVPVEYNGLSVGSLTMTIMCDELATKQFQGMTSLTDRLPRPLRRPRNSYTNDG